MEKFIKDYGVLILAGVAIYWFFIRNKTNGALLPGPEESNAVGSDCGCGNNMPCGSCTNAQSGDASCCTNAGCSGENNTCDGMSMAPGAAGSRAQIVRGRRPRRRTRTASRYY